MHIIQRLIFAAIFAIGVSSCGTASEKEAHRSQALLDEGDLLLKTRHFEDAETKALQAIDKLDPLVKGSPDKIDWRLLYARAHFTLFMARNTTVIERAKPRPRSLVRLPEAHEYIDYDETIRVSENELKELANLSNKYTFDQESYIHGMLAAGFRLNENTLDDAIKEYGKALTVYRSEYDRLMADTTQSHRMAIIRLKNQIQGLEMSQSEVALLAEDWNGALTYLGKAMAKDDLEFFPYQFEALDAQITDLETKLEEEAEERKESRGEALLKSIRSTRGRTLSAREQVGGQNPYKSQLLQAKLLLSTTQNNLMYRIICYYNLSDRARLQRARTHLNTYYPELHEELNELLQTHR